jgi:hypothetical protein
MGDDLPDVAYELARLAFQHKSIEITVLDQRAQLADFVAEREALRSRIGELEATPAPRAPDGASPGDELRALKAAAEIEREILGAQARLAEIAALERRYEMNITASQEALEGMDRDIASLKEAHGG